MNKLPVVSHNDKSMRLVQSIEKEQDTLSLRKKLAKEHGLTSIGEFIEWWAIVYKDKRYRIMNKQWEYMRDSSIKNLQYKKIDTSWSWRIGFSYEEWNMNGNGDFVRTEEDNTDIIQSKNWIFSAKDGIIIVVDDRSYSPWSRLYTTQWNRILIAEGREFERFAVTGVHYYDNFSLLWHFMYCSRWSDIHCYDRRKNIIQGMIPVEISHKFKQRNSNIYRDMEKIHNLWYDSYWYNLVNTDWKFLKTELGQYYAYPSRVKSKVNHFDWLLICVHSELSATLHKEKWEENKQEFVLYAVDKNGNVFRDEFGEIVFSTNANRINNFNEDWYTKLLIDKRIFSISQITSHDIDEYVCWIDRSWNYLKDQDHNIIIDENYFKKQPKNSIDNEIKNKIDRWDTKERIYKVLSEDLTIYGYGTKIDHESPRWWLNSYWGDAKIVNTKMNFKNVQFPDGKDIFNYDFDHDFEQFWKSFIFHGNHVHPRWWRTYECLKINGLIARYNKDEEWKELENISTLIKSVDDKYIFIQRKEWESYYILNKHFQYIKDKNWEKLSFPNRPPFYVDGIFLYYDTIDWEPQTRSKKEMYVRKAYFEDGTEVWESISSLSMIGDLHYSKQQELFKYLGSI